MLLVLSFTAATGIILCMVLAPPRPRHAVDDALVAVEKYTNSPVLNRIVRKGIFT